MAFAGYLIKLGGSSGTELPLDYILIQSYDIESLKHKELLNREDVTGKTHRTVSEHVKTSIKFSTRSMNNTSLDAMNSLISSAMSDADARDITIEYYDPASGTYKVADCYMPEPKYPIRKVEQTAIIFDSFDIEFIEY